MLDNRIVAGEIEYEELTRYNVITPHRPNNPRLTLFRTIKYPNHEFYQGPWGPEIIMFPKKGHTDINLGCIGTVHCTEARAEEIRNDIRDRMFYLSPGND